jgi:hypothetical protein
MVMARIDIQTGMCNNNGITMGNRFGVPGLLCGGRGLPPEVAVGKGAACGQGDGGDGQGEGVAVVEGAGGGVYQGARGWGGRVSVAGRGAP